MWRLDVSAEAEGEIFEAALCYDREKSGLGLQFKLISRAYSLGLRTTRFRFLNSKRKRGELY